MDTGREVPPTDELSRVPLLHSSGPSSPSNGQSGSLAAHNDHAWSQTEGPVARVTDRVGRYQLQGKLGEGGMGVVYKAYDPLLQRVVAVKLIAGNMDDDPDLRDRFFTEARAAGHLSHRNLVTIHDLGEEQGQPYFAMEFLEGRDLGRRMRSQEPMTLTRKLDIVSQVAEGLRYAHALGVTHRDIKPGNIFLTSSGEVKLLDFGLARLHGSELTRTHSVLGTISYMAPEQIRGERADGRTDQFALGVVLYELLSGRRAFEGDSFATTLHKILEGAPEPLGKLDPCLPPELIHIVDRTLAKAPEDRYQRVDDFLVALTAFRVTIRGSDPSCLGREPGEPGQVKTGSDSAVPVTPIPVALLPGPAPSQAPAGRLRRRLIVFGAVGLAVLVGVLAWPFLTSPRQSESASQGSASVGTASSPADTPPAPQRPPATSAVTPTPPAPREERAAPTGTTGGAGSPRDLPEPKKEKPAPTGRVVSGPAASRPARAASDDAARESAQTALVEMGRRKGRAESANAQELASGAFEAARTAEQRARRQLEAGAYGAAAAGLEEAGRLFERAESEGRAEEARRAERRRELTDRLDTSRRRYHDARGRAADAGAESSAAALLHEASARAAEGENLAAGGDLDRAAQAFDAGTTALEEAARRAAAALKHVPTDTPAERGPTEADRRAAAEREVAEVLDRYARALESRT
ncbi:MAG: serine/threonine protein kinase, partial [Acidobacteria bacterium]